MNPNLKVIALTENNLIDAINKNTYWLVQSGNEELPCTVSNINSCNEIIKLKESGLIITVKDVKALFNTTGYVLYSKRESKNMSIKSKAHEDSF